MVVDFLELNSIDVVVSESIFRVLSFTGMDRITRMDSIYGFECM